MRLWKAADENAKKKSKKEKKLKESRKEEREPSLNSSSISSTCCVPLRSLKKVIFSADCNVIKPVDTSVSSSLPEMAAFSGATGAEVRKAATEFISFLNKAVTPFHAVHECAARLRSAGFVELKEGDPWDIRPSAKYFVTKNRSAILAFAVGGAYRPGAGFSIVVGHTDSPCLRVKPISKQQSDKFLQVGVSTYGGGIWRTWFDRDLSLAGEVVFKQEGKLSRRLINVAKPVLFIPNLAIHLETDRVKFECNNETNLRPILESFAAAGLQAKKEVAEGATERDPRGCVEEHHPLLLELVCEAAGGDIQPEQIVDLDLYLYDTQPAAITGAKEEFISGARLDNLVGTYTAISGLLSSLEGVDNERVFHEDAYIRMAACFDNEEVGSETAMGAASAFTEHVLRKLSASGSATAFEEAIANSVLISGDQAHAAHPNYSAKHEENHRPCFHGGVVVKVNVNQRYATTSSTHSALKQIAFEAGVPLQKMIVRNDSPCGSTVGPILAAKLGLAVVDVGCPQLAMHSIREFGDTSSIWQATKLFQMFFNRLPTVWRQLM